MSVLDEDELRALMADLELDRVERTSSINNRDKLCRAICSFSNDFPGYGLPGYLLVGVDDDGRPSGLRVTDDILLKLGGLRTDGLVQPMPAMVVDRVKLPEGDVAVEVRPDNFPLRNDYRNPVVAEAMKVLGFVNKYGRGVIRAQAELRANGNPEAEYRFDPGFVEVTIRGVPS